MIKFIMDYRGVLTNEVFFSAGDTIALKKSIEAALIADGRAVSLDPPEITPSPPQITPDEPPRITPQPPPRKQRARNKKVTK